MRVLLCECPERFPELCGEDIGGSMALSTSQKKKLKFFYFLEISADFVGFHVFQSS